MIDELWPGGPQFIDDDSVFRLSTDSVLLAHFAKNIRAKKAVDLGCGSGIISTLLAWNNPEICIDGVEIASRAVNLARQNAELNGLNARINVIEGDLRCYRELFTAGGYDLCVSNPPYFAQGRGKLASGAGMAAARSEEFCTFADICKAAGYLVRWGGSLTLVHKPERLAEIFRELYNTGFEPKRMRFVQHKSVSMPSIVLIESRRGGNPSLTVEAPLILVNDDGSDSDEVKAIYHR
ncbi:MAG: methyltransferase [Oscillospiraceae bacterium]|nr:methyltransferase [Oscillospiraceae bacterium]